MPELTTTLTVVPIPVPGALDAPDAHLFLEMVRLANAEALADTGHDSLHEEPGEVLGFWQHQEDWVTVGFAAVDGDDVVGAVRVEAATEPGTTTVSFDMWIDVDRRGQGAEELLLAEVEREARDRGITTIQTWSLHRPGTPGQQLVPTTGFGEIPADDHGARFGVAHGFTLEQVERNSVFDLTGDLTHVRALLDDALAAAGPEYRLVTWSPPAPDEFVEGFGHALSRMSTDAPQGGTVVDEQTWDADRVRRREARHVDQGLTVSIAAAVHVPTGAIAAYNELSIAEDPTAATQQYGTLVLREHRGNRLGMVVKCANLLRWREIAPDSPVVSTFNAEENRHMLDINVAIGFVPASYAGAWKKVLA